LAYETATALGSLALLTSQTLLGETFLTQPQNHEAGLIGALDTLLKKTGRKLKDVGVLAVSTGPGSFTGLRVGIASARALAQALGLKIVPVSTLEALAFQSQAKTICPLLDARKSQVYAACYARTARGLKKVWGPVTLRPEELASKIKSPVLFLGEGWELYKDAIKARLGGLVLEDPSPVQASAEAVGRVALEYLKKNGAKEYFMIEPNYLRKPEAELNRKKVKGKK